MQLHFTQMGTGQTLLILHGLFGASDNWITIGRQLSNSFSVYLIDQRNHGASPHSTQFTYLAMAQDIKELMEAEGITQAMVAGHSMGGKTAMLLATTYPELVQKLVVIDIAPKAYPVHHNTILAGLKSINLATISSRGEADAALAAYVPTVNIRQFLLKNLKRTPNGFSWKINLDVISANIEEVGKPLPAEARFAKPTLFIRGGVSNYIDKEEDMPLILTHFPQAKLVTIKGASHWVHAEKPAEFLAILEEFLM